jgi:hypothetical protein
MPVSDSDTVLLITRNGMGDAEPELQLKLITTYFKLLDENNEAQRRAGKVITL